MKKNVTYATSKFEKFVSVLKKLDFKIAIMMVHYNVISNVVSYFRLRFIRLIKRKFKVFKK